MVFLAALQASSILALEVGPFHLDGLKTRAGLSLKFKSALYGSDLTFSIFDLCSLKGPGVDMMIIGGVLSSPFQIVRAIRCHDT